MSDDITGIMNELAPGVFVGEGGQTSDASTDQDSGGIEPRREVGPAHDHESVLKGLPVAHAWGQSGAETAWYWY